MGFKYDMIGVLLQECTKMNSVLPQLTSN